MRPFLLLFLSGLALLAQTVTVNQPVSGTWVFTGPGSQVVATPWAMASPPVVSCADHATGAHVEIDWSWAAPASVTLTVANAETLDCTILAGAVGAAPPPLSLAALSDAQVLALTNAQLLTLTD